MKFEDLTREQQEQVQACKNPEEILALARDAGYELGEEELSQLSGGA